MIVEVLKVFLEAVRLIAETARVTEVALRVLACSLKSLYEREGTGRESACRGHGSDYRGL